MELQLLLNTPSYIPNGFVIIPSVMFSQRIRATIPWIAIIVIFGKWTIGVRLYWGLE